MTTIPTLFVYFLYDHIPAFFYIFKKCFLLLVCILFSDILNDLCTSLISITLRIFFSLSVSSNLVLLVLH